MEINVSFRRATRDDVSHIVKMLADDPLGSKREHAGPPLPESYFQAFDAIDRDPNNELIVACRESDVIGVMQLTFIPNLTYQGGWRALIEGVHIRSDLRSQGIGKKLIHWAIARAGARGCRLVQLTTDKTRAAAKRFYESVGFVASHEGMKFHLVKPNQSATAGV